MRELSRIPESGIFRVDAGISPPSEPVVFFGAIRDLMGVWKGVYPHFPALFSIVRANNIIHLMIRFTRPFKAQAGHRLEDLWTTGYDDNNCMYTVLRGMLWDGQNLITVNEIDAVGR
mmetsp:Transcript_9724/g.24450  ORF Transcript_9724/g.24450 Transcript_9724/m.24450 type:complete len:117 (-) Transcript_9724:448-798(-)